MTVGMKLAAAVFIIAGVFAAGWLTAESMRSPGIEIIEKTKTVTEYINAPATDADCWKCMTNPLDIDGKINGKRLRVWATDGCRKSERDFILEATAAEHNNIIQIGYIYLLNGNHGAEILYFRKFGRFAIGAGAMGSIDTIGIVCAGQYYF